MKILITGATGFIGRHIVHLLHSQEHKLALVVLDTEIDSNLENHNTQLIKGDLTNLDSVKSSIRRFNPEVCIHLAWDGIPDFSQQKSRLNLNLSIDALDFILDNTDCNKVIVAGSCWEYGKKYGACKESDAVIIKTYFTWAKHSLNEYLTVKCAEKGVTLIWFRLFYVYGPGQREGSLIPMLVKSISESKTPSIKSPMNRNDFLFVTDVAKAFHTAAIKTIPSGIYNLGSGTSTGVYEVCKITEQLITGQNLMSLRLRNVNSENEVTDFWADVSKTSRILGWMANTSPEDGISKYIDALRSGAK